jgi:two-component system, response regulator, stage 0 sporulation protein F
VWIRKRRGVLDKIKVLVVDDKKVIGDMFDIILGYSGHIVTVIQNANEAIETVKREEFDIAFLDIVMPESDGITILEKFKAIAPTLPVVMMSGYSVEEKRNRVKELGAITCLKKPFELEDVRKIVKSAIGKDI